MAQLYFLDSLMLIHHGLPPMAYQGWEDWDPLKHGISTSAQSLPPDHPMFGKPWFYVPSVDRYYQRDDGNHPVMVVIAEQFAASRWEDIEEALEEICQPNRILEGSKYSKLKKRFQKLEQKGEITLAELTVIEGILDQYIP